MKVEEIPIEEDGTFEFIGLVSPDEFPSEMAFNVFKTVAGPEIIETDAGEMIVAQRYSGKFDNPETMTGIVKIGLCEMSWDEKSKQGIEWKAEWKQP